MSIVNRNKLLRLESIDKLSNSTPDPEESFFCQIQRGFVVRGYAFSQSKLHWIWGSKILFYFRFCLPQLWEYFFQKSLKSVVPHLCVLWENRLLLEDDVESEARVVVRAAFVLGALPHRRGRNDLNLNSESFDYYCFCHTSNGLQCMDSKA